jgi:hypothetical protein
MFIVPWLENLMERDVTDGGKIMLKWIFKKEDGKARI